jgi:hypothetical protein
MSNHKVITNTADANSPVNSYTLLLAAPAIGPSTASLVAEPTGAGA